MVQQMPYPQMFQPEPEDQRPVAAARTMFLDRVDAGAAKSIVERLEDSSAAMAVTQLRVLGGAMARVPADATAFAHRQGRIMANVAAIFERADERPLHESWVSALTAELDQGDPAAYVGFLGDEGGERVRAAYPGSTWTRLAEVKAQYDPHNLFRLNQNIPPASD
jgi:FAD/FMN-containing dehydrogenase